MGLKEFKKINTPEMEKAIKIVEEEGIDNFKSDLCSSDLFIMPKKTGFLMKKRKNVTMILSDDCARQIINRSKMNKYLKLIKGEKYPVKFDENKIYAYGVCKLINKVNEVYNSKCDDSNFDNVVKELVDTLSNVVSFDKKEKVATITFSNENIDKIKDIILKVNVSHKSINKNENQADEQLY